MGESKKPRGRSLFERDLMVRAEKAYARHEIKSVGACGFRWSLVEKFDGGWSSNLWAEIVVLAGGSLLVHGDFEPCIRSSRAEALADVAVVCGLRPDGSDPAAELERLRCVTRTRLTPPQGA